MSEPGLLSPEVRSDPYPYYAYLRSDGGIHKEEPFGLWVVSRYEDVVHVLKNPQIFSSAAMGALSSGAVSAAGRSVSSGAERTLSEAKSLIATDPPDHERMRHIVNRGFTPRRVAELESRVREIAEEMVDQILPSGSMELVHDVSVPVPVRVIAEMLGVPAERYREFRRWSDAMVSSISSTQTEVDKESLAEARRELVEFLTEVAEERRKNLKDDLFSTLVRAEQEEGVLSHAEVVSFGLLLLVAGNETTTNLIGNAMVALLDNPDQLERVQKDPKLISKVVEETVRFNTPVQALLRQPTEDVILAGQKISAGERMFVLFASANRDEQQFPEPDRFDIDRDTRGHVGFGFGIHFCLGASLARLEARVTLETILSRCRNLRRDECEPIEWVDSFLLRGPRKLMLRFDT